MGHAANPGVIGLLRAGSTSLAMFLPSCSGRLLLKELEMPPALPRTALLPIVLWAALCFANAVGAVGGLATTAAAAERADIAPDVSADARVEPLEEEDWRRSFSATSARARILLQAGYERAPALMIALAAFLVLPAVALVSFLVQAAGRRSRQRAAVRAAQLRALDAEPNSETSPDAEPLPGPGLWTHGAWLTVVGASAGTLALDSRLVRIGRHQDNDIRLPDTTVHRYHAVIERTADEAFVITDLSGESGNGVRINGERLPRAQLTDGDVIELGRTRLKFESAPA